MYTFWKRTVPPPSMVAFDAPNREVCTVTRSITNTPLQALVLLNDPQFVEASRGLAQRLLQAGPADTNKRIETLYEIVTARLPRAEETEILERALRRADAQFADDPVAAAQLLGVGESTRDAKLDAVEHAAWTVVANLVLNLSEAVTRQ